MNRFDKSATNMAFQRDQGPSQGHQRVDQGPPGMDQGLPVIDQGQLGTGSIIGKIPHMHF